MFPEKFWIIACDLSLKRPGFCRFRIERGDSGLTINDFDTTSLDNKNSTTKSHGQLIDEIGKTFVDFIPEDDGSKIFFVREKAFNARAAQSEMAIYKVVGFMDWVLYRMHQQWYELYPVTVKKLITGSGKADKTQVAEMLPYYYGIKNYANDDESDAAAVAAAFLIENGIIKTVNIESKGGEDDVSAPPEVHQGV